MKQILLLFTGLLVLILAGCSLTDADTPDSGSAGLRLLTGTGEPTTLSHPDYDDWSPQMVNWQGNKFLYFLSKRPYSGAGFGTDGWETPRSNAAGNTGIFRAEEVRPGVYSNLRLYHSMPAGETISAIAVISNYSELVPQVYLVTVSGGVTNTGFLYTDNGDVWADMDGYTSGYPYMGGAWVSSGMPRVFVGSIMDAWSSIGPLSELQFLGLVFKSHNTMEAFDGNAVLSIKLDIANLSPAELLLLKPYWDAVSARSYNKDSVFRGSAPAIFTTDAGDTFFGFYVSQGGRLLQLVYLGCPDYATWEYNTSFWDLNSIVGEPEQLLTQRLVPLFSLTHYAGTIDRDPSSDQQNGNLFFASDREGRGNFDLYYVPQEYLRVPAGVIPSGTEPPQPF